MPRRLTLVTAALAVTALAVPAVGQAKVSLKVNPTTPIVDDSVTVGWRADRNLKPGYHYEGALVGRTGNCAGFVSKESKRKPTKGQPMSFTFSPYDDNINGGPEWCQGKASIMVSIAKDGDVDGKTGAVLSITDVRFVAKP